MAQNPRRVALMLDLQWPYKRHAGIFAGTRQLPATRMCEVFRRELGVPPSAYRKQGQMDNKAN